MYVYVHTRTFCAYVLAHLVDLASLKRWHLWGWPKKGSCSQLKFKNLGFEVSGFCRDVLGFRVSVGMLTV